MCTPLYAGGRGVVQSPTKLSKKGTWQDLYFEREVAGTRKEGATFLSRGTEGSQFLHKK